MPTRGLRTRDLGRRRLGSRAIGLPGVAGGLATGLLMAGLQGCTPGRTSTPAREVIAVDVAATWATIRAAQAERLEALGRFSGAGDATIRFTDEDGDRRSEQVDVRIWRVAPCRAAARLSKVGQSFLLAGWNGDRWWLLDESNDAPVLTIRRFGAATDEPGAAGLLSPPTFLALLGLLPWPEAPPASLHATGLDGNGDPTGYRFELDRVAWASPDGGEIVVAGRARVEMRDPRAGPSSLEFLDDAGEVVITSTLERPEPVETRGRPPGGWPTLAHRVRVKRWNGDEVVVRLDGPLAGGEISDRLFDLDAVRRRVPDALIDEGGAP